MKTKVIGKNIEVMYAVVRPMGYIVPINARVSDYSPFRSLPVVYNLFLGLSLLGRMSGGIYIPRREISYSDSLFGCYAFPAKLLAQGGVQ